MVVTVESLLVVGRKPARKIRTYNHDATCCQWEIFEMTVIEDKLYSYLIDLRKGFVKGSRPKSNIIKQADRFASVIPSARSSYTEFFDDSTSIRPIFVHLVHIFSHSTGISTRWLASPIVHTIIWLSPLYMTQKYHHNSGITSTSTSFFSNVKYNARSEKKKQ